MKYVVSNWSYGDEPIGEAFARLSVPPEAFLPSYPCNHIHGIVGERVDELLDAADRSGNEAIACS
ncbi:MAG: hypothetical protein MUO23_12380 [Anaerolineales bacterium]|nr:hypothetical protein [Anaerolineales bacterium]